PIGKGPGKARDAGPTGCVGTRVRWRRSLLLRRRKQREGEGRSPTHTRFHDQTEEVMTTIAKGANKGSRLQGPVSVWRRVRSRGILGPTHRPSVDPLRSRRPLSIDPKNLFAPGLTSAWSG